MVRSVSSDGIRIGDTAYGKSIAITPDDVMEDWPAKPIAELSVDDFETLLEGEPALVVLGTGSQNVFAPRELVFAFARRGIGLEVMDTQAAARTFNVLAGEGRNVVAVLYC
jgi:uncharacterized protein